MKKTLRQLSIVALFGAASLAHASEFKEIRIATEAGYPPFEYVAPSGELQGFNIDIGNEICKRLRLSASGLTSLSTVLSLVYRLVSLISLTPL